jgi:hypothetical protein
MATDNFFDNYTAQLYERGLRPVAAEPAATVAQPPLTAVDMVLSRDAVLEIRPVADSIGGWAVYVGDDIVSPLFGSPGGERTAVEWRADALDWRTGIWNSETKKD